MEQLSCPKLKKLLICQEITFRAQQEEKSTLKIFLIFKKNETFQP